MLEIKFFATLRINRGKLINMEFRNGITGLEILNFFSINQNDVSIFLVNGFHTPLNKEIEDNSVISIFPPVGGG